SDPRQRQLLKNMIYVGALAALIDIEIPVLHEIISLQFKGKDKLIAANFEALDMGIEYVRKHFK
ncbi:MAG: 2-oxoacid:acceptor oxidoreductase family protein, partial [Saprospiraceae bacterium]|nr:2-oxoacid:acceptor oxidoreductase family protein [Saprospiraceae bacterium]